MPGHAALHSNDSPPGKVTSAAAISACAQGAEWELALELLERCSFTGSSGAAIVSAINACARGGGCVTTGTQMR